MTNFLVIGDSIVYGINDETRMGWAGHLHEKLKPYFPGKFRFYNRGIGGDCSIDVQQRLGSEISALQPDYIIIAVGVNDTQILLPGNQPSISNLKASRTWHKILSVASGTNAKIVVISPLPVDDASPVIEKEAEITGVTAVDYKTKYISEYNEMLKKVCSHYDVKYFDLFSLWQEIDYAGMLTDGLHPNAKGHQLISEQIFALLNEHKIISKEI